jgi:hypothetical protein
MQLNDASPLNIKKKEREKTIHPGWMEYCHEVGRELFIELHFIDIQFKIDDKLGKWKFKLSKTRHNHSKCKKLTMKLHKAEIYKKHINMQKCVQKQERRGFDCYNYNYNYIRQLRLNT